MVLAVVVVLLDDELRRVDMVHPGRRLLIVCALAGDGVHQHRAVVVRAAEEADGLLLLGADPVGGALLVDLKDRLLEHIGRVVEAQVPVEVPGEVLRRGVLHALREAHHIHALVHHVDDEVGGQTLGAVVEPLDDVPVAQGRHPDGPPVVVDLGVVLRHLELGHHVAELAQLPVPQLLGAVPVQHGDAVIGHLLDVLREGAALQGQELAVGPGPEDHHAHKGADGDGDDQRRRQEEGHGALLLGKLEVALRPGALEAGGQQGADAVHPAAEEEEDVALLAVEVHGRQGHVEVDRREEQRHAQVDEGPGHAVADGLAGLAGLFLPLLPDHMGLGIPLPRRAAALKMEERHSFSPLSPGLGRDSPSVRFIFLLYPESGKKARGCRPRTPRGTTTLTDAPNSGTEFGWRRPCPRYGVPSLVLRRARRPRRAAPRPPSNPRWCGPSGS